MNITDISTRIEIVNDEILYIMDLNQVAKLTSMDEIDGVTLGGPDIVNSLMKMKEFIENHNEFVLAMYKGNFGQTRFRWLFCPLYQIDNMWTKVQIEYIVCDNCGWEGKIANPTMPSLYFTLKNRKEALDKAWNLPRMKCPNCGMDFNQYCIWVE